MTTRLLRTLPIALLLTGLLATPVFAKGNRHRGHSSRHHSKHSYRHHGHHRHHSYYRHHGYHHRPSVSFGFYSGPTYAPYYPYYAAPPAVVYREPVYVGTPAVANVEIQVQRELAKRGYYGGVIDGAIGSQTRAAIRTYQVDKNLPVTGRIDGNLLRSLRLL